MQLHDRTGRLEKMTKDLLNEIALHDRTGRIENRAIPLAKAKDNANA